MHTPADLTRALACAAIHDDLVVALDTALLFLREVREDGVEVLPDANWHGWKHMRSIADRARRIPRLEDVDG